MGIVNCYMVYIHVRQSGMGIFCDMYCMYYVHIYMKYISQKNICRYVHQRMCIHVCTNTLTSKSQGNYLQQLTKPPGYYQEEVEESTTSIVHSPALKNAHRYVHTYVIPMAVTSTVHNSESVHTRTQYMYQRVSGLSMYEWY